MRKLATCLLALALFAGSPAMAAGSNNGETSAANSPAPAEPAAAANPATPAESRMESELQELRDLLVMQGKQFQEENQQLKDQLEQQKEQVRLLKDSLAAASGGGEPVAEASSAIDPGIGVEAVHANGDAAAQDKNEPPTAIHIKGITLTPGGFMEGAAVWRQRALSSDVVTPFNTIPFSGASQAQMSEFNVSGRQSRISMLVEGKLHDVKIGGYYETDFLGTGITSNYTESNSFVLRQRQFFGQAAFDSGWMFTGGQMWTLLTETRRGLDNRTEVLPLVIDGQYHVGFSWARQPGFRVTKNFDNKVWLGFSVENAETTLTAHGANNNFIVGQYGASGGLLNPVANFAFSTAPDFVFKAAFEPGWGHYEIFGVVSTFRDRVFPNETAETPSAAGAFNDHRVGGGIGANARVPLFNKHLDAAIHFLGGDGIGRYGSATLADVTARPDGTLAPIRNFQSLASLEWHTTPKLDIYAYVGGEYDARTGYIKSGSEVPNEGYGAIGLANYGCLTEPLPGSATSTATGVGGSAGFVPGSLAECTGDTRNVIQGTLGFWYRFYQGPMGRVQTGLQYSYINRNTWSGAGATADTLATPHAVENMVMTSFRYYLP
ncbi:MAG TPA: hypothetical protein VEJ38_14455 [Candidatus Acidoferrales bacterium]|nr:hypothetical protein [Candidatus Acidoferrales bacterium]